jgi:uncharacterized protein
MSIPPRAVERAKSEEGPRAQRRAGISAFAQRRQRAYLNHMPEASAKLCPMCRKPAADRFRPFCSARCKDVDLNRWFKGTYAIPAVESEDDSEAPEPANRERRSD